MPECLEMMPAVASSQPILTLAGKHSGHSSELEGLGAPAVTRNKCVAANSLFLLVFSLNGSPRPEPGTEGRLGEPCLLGPFHEAPSLF